MSAVEVIGWAGTLSGTILGLPQVLRLARTGRVDGLSLTAWRAMLVVNLIWTAHGISIGQAPQICDQCPEPVLHRPHPVSDGARTAAPLAAGAAAGAAGRRGSDCVDQILGSATFGAAAIIAAVVANAGQSIELVRAKRIVGVSLFLILAVVNQALWLSWAILVPDIGTMIFATVTGTITAFNLIWWSLRMLGLQPLSSHSTRP